MTVLTTAQSLWSARSELFWAVLVFAACMLLLDWLHISLPRGDTMGVAGALCGAGLLLFGPVLSAAVSVGSDLVAELLRHGTRAPRRMGISLFARTMGVLSGIGVMRIVDSHGNQGPDLYLAATLVPAVFILAELIAAQVAAAVTSGRPLGRLVLGNLVAQAPLLLAEWSASVLLLITFPYMGAWSLVPVVLLLLLMRQAYALYLSIRETYRTTVEVLVEAAEGQDARLVGHAERTAEVARRIASRMGLSASQVEVVSYAALLHDVGVIGSAGSDSSSGAGHSSDVFEGVEFFADVLPVLRLCDGRSDQAYRARDYELAGAMIVCLASDADAAEHAEVSAAHRCPAVARVAPSIPRSIKARAVASALELGYKIPAVS